MDHNIFMKSCFSSICSAYMEPDRLQKRYRQKRSTPDTFGDHISGRSKRAIPLIIYPEILVIVDYDGYRLHGGDNIQVSWTHQRNIIAQIIRTHLRYCCYFGNLDQTVFCVILEWCWPSLSFTERTKNSHQHCRHNYLTSKYICHSIFPSHSHLAISISHLLFIDNNHVCTNAITMHVLEPFK